MQKKMNAGNNRRTLVEAIGHQRERIMLAIGAIGILAAIAVRESVETSLFFVLYALSIVTLIAVGINTFRVLRSMVSGNDVQTSIRKNIGSLMLVYYIISAPILLWLMVYVFAKEVSIIIGGLSTTIVILLAMVDTWNRR